METVCPVSIYGAGRAWQGGVTVRGQDRFLSWALSEAGDASAVPSASGQGLSDTDQGHGRDNGHDESNHAESYLQEIRVCSRPRWRIRSLLA